VRLYVTIVLAGLTLIALCFIAVFVLSALFGPF
jgi:hypothetical protein